MTMNVMQFPRSGRDPRRLARRMLLGVAALIAATLSAGAMAQTAEGSTADDPPGRVARLADFSGQVWVYTPEGGDWVAAVRNQPLTTGDRVATDTGSRAELQVGSTTLRLDAGSELEVAQLDDTQLALQLQSGSVAARVRSADAARELSVGTDDGGFRTDLPGRYRFDHLNNVSGVTVYSGQGAYAGDGVALTVTGGQHAEFWIDEQHVAQYALRAVVQDAFSAWVNERDASDDRYAAAQTYVSPEMTGADDLARYGSWEQTPEDGAVWVPTGVAADWAPYSTGHWGFVRPWGWTWIDDAPWGFAPFHYGRWLRARDRWCWAPGNIVARPIYAPALVAWVGGVGVSVGVGGPPVGWYPLAPRDVYVPSYRYSPRYVRAINVGTVRDVARIDRVVSQPPNEREFGNRRYPNAVTIVPTNVFTSRQPVGPAAAQARGTAWARELATQPARGQTLAAPPVATPAAVARADARAGPPPGMRRPMPVRRPPVQGAAEGAAPPAAQGGPIRPGQALVPRPPTAPAVSRPSPIEDRRPLPGAAQPAATQRAPNDIQRLPQLRTVPRPDAQRPEAPQPERPQGAVPPRASPPPQAPARQIQPLPQLQQREQRPPADAQRAPPDARQTAQPPDRGGDPKSKPMDR